MRSKYKQFKAEWEFRKAVKNKLVLPKDCKTSGQLSKSMEDLHFLIHEIRLKYNFVPQSASVLFDQYNCLHEKLVYEQILQNRSI